MPSEEELARHVVVVGHGMVGHRFVEAMRARDTEASWRITVLAEEQTLPTTQSGSLMTPVYAVRVSGD